ncbi:MAG TPA: hypothetical protein ENN40_06195 [Candidatus Aminicenantes bacterium]|nr:hypothetical protein [Candidatus Aminicenantes bacterium]
MKNAVLHAKSFYVAVMVLWIMAPFHLNPENGALLQPSTWEIVESTGEITITETSPYRERTWSFPAELDSGANWIRVNPPGELEYSLAFAGVEGSSHPDGLNHGGTGKASGGEVFGLTEHEKNFGAEGSQSTQSKISGTYDSVEMTFSWSTSTVIKAGRLVTKINGTGFVKGRRLIVDSSRPAGSR